MAIEIERRFLIELPLTWYASFKLRKCKKIDICQTYLANHLVINGEKANSRVRRSETRFDKYTQIKYTLTTKNIVSPGINNEIEYVISHKEFLEKLKLADNSKKLIAKSRYEIPYGGKTFELDVFQNEYEGLAILEIELLDLKETITLPPFLKVIKEINL